MINVVYRNRKLLVIFIFSLSSHAWAEKRWSSWGKHYHDGVTNCSRQHARDVIGGLCKSVITRGERLVDVEIHDLKVAKGRKGFNARWCTESANYRCLIQYNLPIRNSEVDARNETLVKNNCNQSVYVSTGSHRRECTDPFMPGQDISPGCRYGYSEKFSSRGHYRIDPGQERLLEGNFLFVDNLTRDQMSFCVNKEKEFNYYYNSGNKNSQYSECSHQGGSMEGFEYVGDYWGYTLCGNR